jgi:lysozyme
VQAEAYLIADLHIALNATLRYWPVLATQPERRLAAIVDFTFNLGAGRLQSSTLRRQINQRDWPAAAHELRRWVYSGGRILPRLAARREAEVILSCLAESGHSHTSGEQESEHLALYKNPWPPNL